jgi:hypothetical protein
MITVKPVGATGATAPTEAQARVVDVRRDAPAAPSGASTSHG